MNWRRLLLTAVATALFVAVQFAQNSADGFSGTYRTIDKDPFKQRSLLIQVRGDEVKASEQYYSGKQLISNQMTLFLDKRGERNLLRISGVKDPIDVTSNTSFTKGKIVRHSSFRTSSTDIRSQTTSDQRGTDEYSLSPDGKTLTMKSYGHIERETKIVGVLPGLQTQSRIPVSSSFSFERKYSRQE